MLWACASWHSGRQQTSAHLLWMFSPPISRDFRVDILPLFRPTVSMLHNPYTYSHSFQNFLPAQVWGPWWNCRAHSTSDQKASSREWSGNSSCASREHAPYWFWSYRVCSWTIHWKETCLSHASFFLALLSLTSFLPKRLKDPPSRVKSYYHHPLFILTTMLRQASTLIRERRRVGDDKATKI